MTTRYVQVTEIPKLVAAIVSYIVKNRDLGAVLIFMPGVQEIRQCIEALKAVSLGATTILPLHANLSSDEQRVVFLPTDKRKIVVATNVAEVGISLEAAYHSSTDLPNRLVLQSTMLCLLLTEEK